MKLKLKFFKKNLLSPDISKRLMLNTLIILIYILLSCSLTLADTGPYQIVSLQPSLVQTNNSFNEDITINTDTDSSFNLYAYYDVSNGYTQLFGLGIRIHYESSKLMITEYDEYRGCIIAGPSIQDDIKEYYPGGHDYNETTDKFILIAWVDTSFQGWPGSSYPFILGQNLPLMLIKITFSVKSEFTEGSTNINVSFSDTPVGYEGLSNKAIVAINRLIENNSISRSISNNQDCSTSVSLMVTPATNVKAYAVEEYLPQGLFPDNINENGTWDESTNSIYWGTFRTNSSKAFHYSLTGVDGSYLIEDGHASFDGFSQEISGDNEAIINCPVLKAGKPVFNPFEGQVPLSVSITSETQDAIIYYTKDGSTPDSNSYEYTGTLFIDKRTVIRAIAIKQGMFNSDISTGKYFQAYIEPGSVTRTVIHNNTCYPEVKIELIPDSSVKSYAVEETLAQGYEPLTINENGIWDPNTNTILWGTYRDKLHRNLYYTISGNQGNLDFDGKVSFDGINYPISNLETAVIDCSDAKTAMPVFSSDQGTVPLNITITCETPDAAIYYTLDGSNPYSGSNIYTSPVSISDRTLLKAIAIKPGLLNSDVQSALYVKPVISQAELTSKISDNQTCMVSVSLSITPYESTKSYAINQILPPDIMPLNINEDGLWSSNNNTIIWGTYQDSLPRTFNYSLKGENSSFAIEGVLSINGISEDISDIQAEIMCENRPSLTVYPLAYTVSASAGSVDFTIYNAKTGHMDWEVTRPSYYDWYDIDVLYRGNESGNFRVNYEGYNYNYYERTAKIIVSAIGAENSPQTVIIKQMEYEEIGADPVLSLHSLDYTVSASSGSFDFTIHISEPIDTNWALESNDEWINIDTIYRTNQSGHLRVNYDNNSGYARTAQINVLANGAQNSPQTITIKQKVLSQLYVEPLAYTVSAASGSVDFTIFILKPIDSNWSLESNDEWIDIGIIHRDNQYGYVRVNYENYSGYERRAQINVFANGIQNSPQAFTILQMGYEGTNELPIISSEPSSLSVFAIQGSVSYTIYNSGKGTMNWSASSQNNWLRIKGDNSGVDNGIIIVEYDKNYSYYRTGRILINAPNAVNNPAILELNQFTNSRPVISYIGNQVTNEDVPLDIQFTIHDLETKSEDLSISVEAISPAYQNPLAIDYYAISRNGENFTLTLTPTKDEYGSNNILLTIYDSIEYAYRSFELTVNPVNDPPLFTSSFVPVVYEDDGNKRIAWADNIKPGPANESNQDVNFIISPLSHSLFSSGPSIDTEGVISFKTAPDAYGSAVFEVRLKDNGGIESGGVDTSDIQKFTVIIQSVNDCPYFVKGNDLNVLNNDGHINITQWAKNISAGQGEEDQSILFHTTTNNDSLFEIIPNIYSDGTLSFKPADDQTGSAIVTVYATDSGGNDYAGCNTSSAQQFTITIDQTIYKLTILKEGNGKIDVNGVSVLPKWEKLYNAGENIKITAIPDPDWKFAYWHGSFMNQSDLINLTINENIEITAKFYEPPVTLSLYGNRQIKVNGVIHDLPDFISFEKNSVAVIEPVPANDFIRWSGDLNANNYPLVITLDKDTTIAAHFNDPNDWNAIFHAQSENFGGKFQDDISIGVSIFAESQQSSLTTTFSCNMFMYSSDWNMLSKDIRKAGGNEYKWIIAINPHGNTGTPDDRTAVISWNPNEFSPDGNYRLESGYDETTNIVVTDMRAINQYNVTGGNSDQYLTLIWSIDQSIYEYSFTTGWNLISLPVIPKSLDIKSLFPFAELVYEYRGGNYIITDTLRPGKGYWLLMPFDIKHFIVGKPFSSYSIPNIPKGWHLIGSINELSVCDGIPSNSIEGIFKHSDGNYQDVNELQPGDGYWIKILEESQIMINKK